MSPAPLLDGPRLMPASGRSPSQLVVILHGYGADGQDLIDLGRAWASTLPDAVFAAPDAPEPLPFEALGGLQWFPLTDRDQREYRTGAESSAPCLNRFIDAELARHDLPANALALVGFSQGAMMALQTGLRRKVPPAALLAYSGLLPGIGHLDAIQTASPVLLIHGSEDDVVDPSHLPAARKALLDAGVRVEDHLLDNLGHSIDERGMVLGERFLAQAFAPASAPKS
jgi:phospholipase/carboxylesterase